MLMGSGQQVWNEYSIFTQISIHEFLFNFSISNFFYRNISIDWLINTFYTIIWLNANRICQDQEWLTETEREREIEKWHVEVWPAASSSIFIYFGWIMVVSGKHTRIRLATVNNLRMIQIHLGIEQTVERTRFFFSQSHWNIVCFERVPCRRMLVSPFSSAGVIILIALHLNMNSCSYFQFDVTDCVRPIDDMEQLCIVMVIVYGIFFRHVQHVLSMCNNQINTDSLRHTALYHFRPKRISDEDRTVWRNHCG